MGSQSSRYSATTTIDFRNDSAGEETGRIKNFFKRIIHRRDKKPDDDSDIAHIKIDQSGGSILNFMKQVMPRFRRNVYQRADDDSTHGMLI
mmetsp:Transcript_15344/g.23102  ORF Transcript_15344/g.23102 Transcript_15344/m.23102 type:complete len:91 (-) Transcript_15344:220-492(-)